MTETYLSLDIESDGPCPGLNSMLSLGAAAFVDGKCSSTFSVNLDQLAEGTSDPATMAWWATKPEAWRECRAKTVHPHEAMRRFYAWIKGLPGRPIAVAYPVGFDFTFVKWYCHRFLGECPLGFQAIDIRSYAMGLLGASYAETQKAKLPKSLLPESRHTHVAVDDAIEQGEMFMRMLAYAASRYARSNK